MFEDNLPGAPFALRQDSTSGLLEFYDSGRTRWVSADRVNIEYSVNHGNIRADQWMKIQNIYSVSNGFLVRRNAIITCLAVRCRDDADATFFVQKNGGTAVTSISLSSETYKITEGLDLVLNKGDWLQALAQVDSGGVDYPILSLELAWIS